MSNILRKMGYVLITPQALLNKLIGSDRQSVMSAVGEPKYMLDNSGTIRINPLNAEVQAAFRRNVQGLATKKQG